MRIRHMRRSCGEEIKGGNYKSHIRYDDRSETTGRQESSGKQCKTSA